VLTEGSYKQQAVELKRENEEMDTLGQIESIISELFERHYLSMIRRGG